MQIREEKASIENRGTFLTTAEREITTSVLLRMPLKMRLGAGEGLALQLQGHSEMIIRG